MEKINNDIPHERKKIIIKGEDLSLTKTMVSLKSMMKTWNTKDQGYLVECRAMEGRVSMEEIHTEERAAVDSVIPPLLKKFKDVF